MKLKNKISGEIKEFFLFDGKELQGGATLKSLAEEWEDVPEEPKEYWYIADNGEIEKDTDDGGAYEERMKEIGNYFETEEEAEKAMKKLKAWKRLKDKGFRFDDWDYYHIGYKFIGKGYWTEETKKDMDLLFGGEE